MSIGFMITNGGPHPPEKWADVTAKAIADLIVIEPSAPVEAVIDKRGFEAALFKLLVEQHRHTQDRARAICTENHDHGDHRHLVHDRATAVAEKVVALAHNTRFAEHFEKPEVRTFLHNVIGQHFANSVHIERSWHADRNRKS